MAQEGLNTYKLIAVCGSAGSLKVILQIAESFPSQAQFSLVIITHRIQHKEPVLEKIIAARTRSRVREIEDKEPIQPGAIYIAPADYHLLVEDQETFCLDGSQKVNFSRPSFDVFFESAAAVFGASLGAILLSGASADGVNGLATVRRKGGYSIVQEPRTASFDFMPAMAIQRGSADLILRPPEIASWINALDSHPLQK